MINENCIFPKQFWLLLLLIIFISFVFQGAVNALPPEWGEPGPPGWGPQPDPPDDTPDDPPDDGEDDWPEPPPHPGPYPGPNDPQEEWWREQAEEHWRWLYHNPQWDEP